jgi:aerobic carbon-monoxide dehydrogenase medium subunit
MTRHRQIEFSPVVAARSPLLHEAIRLVAHLPVRSRGTIGGSLAHADPAAELPMVLRALDGEVVVRGPLGERVIEARDLFTSLFTTSLQPNEILVEVRIPIMPPQAGWAVEEYARRQGDFAIAAIAVVMVPTGKDITVRLATAGVGPIPLRLEAAEAILERSGFRDAPIKEASEVAAKLVDPTADQHASAEYRRHLTCVLTDRALRRALESSSLKGLH